MDNLEFKKAINSFNFKCLNTIGGVIGEENVFYSPISISTVLGMLLAGSKGSTAEQIKSTLSLNNIDSSHSGFQTLIESYKSQGPSRILASQVVLNEGFNVIPEYSKLVRDQYNAQFDTKNLSDPSIVKYINSWAEKNTNGMITDLIKEPFDSMAQLVLMNAIYFKESWTKKFSKDATDEQGKFMNSDDSESQVRMMYKKDKLRVSYSDTFNYSMIELPYSTKSSASMVIVLPNDVKGLMPLLRNESAMESIHEDVTKNVKKAVKTEIELYLPAFEMETTYNLKKLLMEAGITDVFSQEKADLSGMTGTRNLHVAEAIHKAKLIVNEEGSEAAAATVVMVAYRSMPMLDEFRVDHPFLYFIKEDDVILFSGYVVKL